jgi:DNA-binding CsgD family transcriptional regulator
MAPPPRVKLTSSEFADIPDEFRTMTQAELEVVAGSRARCRNSPDEAFRDQDLLDGFSSASRKIAPGWRTKRQSPCCGLAFETLTRREREVMPMVVTGRLNKQIAHEIGISEITCKIHRGEVMRKMKAASLPDLARMADKLNFHGRRISGLFDQRIGPACRLGGSLVHAGVNRVRFAPPIPANLSRAARF